jgi:hypothetical protein
VALGNVLRQLVAPTAYFSENPWKWGLGLAVVTVFTVYYSFISRRKSLGWAVAALAVFAVISFYGDSRSIAALPLLAGAAYAALRGKWGLARFAVLAVILVLLLNAATTAFFASDLVASMLPPSAAAKYQRQAAGTFGVLLGGRSEILGSVAAFLDRPLLGHGSWAKDSGGLYTSIDAQKYYEYGYTDSADGIVMRSSGLIPTHSYFMGALVWSGIIGGVFWLLVLYTVLRSFLDELEELPLYFYVGAVFLIWNLLFSPFGAEARWSEAVFLAAFLTYARPRAVPVAAQLDDLVGRQSGS